MFVTPAFAQAAGGTPAVDYSFLLVSMSIFAIFYFLVMRPQQKKLKEHRALVEAVRRGDQVLTQGGIIGKVLKVNDDGILEVEIADGVKVRIPRSTITTVMNKTEPAQG
jgi:preprotein translocase subunit YajC